VLLSVCLLLTGLVLELIMMFLCTSLVQWLKYSKKEYCELCKHRYIFTPSKYYFHCCITTWDRVILIICWIHDIWKLAWSGFLPYCILSQLKRGIEACQFDLCSCVCVPAYSPWGELDSLWWLESKLDVRGNVCLVSCSELIAGCGQDGLSIVVAWVRVDPNCSTSATHFSHAVTTSTH